MTMTKKERNTPDKPENKDFFEMCVLYRIQHINNKRISSGVCEDKHKYNDGQKGEEHTR